MITGIWAYSKKVVDEVVRMASKKTTGCKKVSHITPRAYCIAKPSPSCAVFVRPWVDAEPQVRNSAYSASEIVRDGVETVEVGDWCALAYVSTPSKGTIIVVDILGAEPRKQHVNRSQRAKANRSR